MIEDESADESPRMAAPSQDPVPGETPSSDQGSDMNGAPEPDGAAAASAALDRAVRSTPKRSTSKPSGTRPPRAHRSRDPLLIGQAVDDLLAERGWEDDSAIATLVTGWAQIVGPELADHVTPAAFTDATLVLQAESTSWATQVRLLLPDLQRVIDDQVGAGVVRQIRVQGPQAPSWSRGSRRVQGRGPRDTYG